MNKPTFPASSLPTAHCPPPTLRRGISLLEVLVSMFVLLFGLMGVAAIFPVGNHYAGRAEQYDRTSALVDQAFAEINARGMLRPSAWLYGQQPASANQNSAGVIMRGGTTPEFNLPPPSGSPPFSGQPGPGHAFILDPLGVAEGWRGYFGRDSSGKYTDAKQIGFEMDLDVFPTGHFNAEFPNGTWDERPYGTNDARNPWHETYPGSVTNLSGERWPIRRITLPATDMIQPTMLPAVAATIMRLQDDLANAEAQADDRPGVVRWRSEVVDAMDDPDKFDPADPATAIYGNDVPQSRAFAGNYSWIATIVPTAIVPAIGNPLPSHANGVNALQPVHPQHTSVQYDVSVAVFHKRVETPSAESERSINAALNVGGELVLWADDNADGVEAVDNAVRDLRPGHWVAVAGVHPTSGLFLLKWYKLLSLDNETVALPGEQINPASGVGPTYAVRRAMVEGPDWPPPPAGGPSFVGNLRAIIMPGVIGVSTQTLAMEGN